MINSLRGEYEATLGGETLRFDTTLGTIASIEERCGDLPILEIVNRAVQGRRARDRMSLLAAAIEAAGRSAGEAEALAAAAAVAEAERFILALMGALGFEIAPRAPEVHQRPLDGASSGGAGGSSPSAV